MVMKLEKVLKFKGIGNRESEIGGSFSLITYARCPIPDALDCFESPFCLRFEKGCMQIFHIRGS